MIYFFPGWKRIKNLFKERILLFLDFDGTLAPIASTPGKAVLPSGTKKVLSALAKRLKGQVVIVTGRALRDIKKKVGVKNIFYIGSHGFEIENRPLPLGRVHIKRIYRTITLIAKKTHERFPKSSGIVIENKKLVLSVHYRRLEQKEQKTFRLFFLRIVRPFLKKRVIRFKGGKKVFELCPPVDWNKGKAVRWFLKKHCSAQELKKTSIFYIGDDKTDEDAFRALKDLGTTIFVGRSKSSAAKYYLKNTGEVKTLLTMFLQGGASHVGN